MIGSEADDDGEAQCRWCVPQVEVEVEVRVACGSGERKWGAALVPGAIGWVLGAGVGRCRVARADLLQR
jgi:hypothetical protein